MLARPILHAASLGRGHAPLSERIIALPALPLRVSAACSFPPLFSDFPHHPSPHAPLHHRQRLGKEPAQSKNANAHGASAAAALAAAAAGGAEEEDGPLSAEGFAPEPRVSKRPHKPSAAASAEAEGEGDFGPAGFLAPAPVAAAAGRARQQQGGKQQAKAAPAGSVARRAASKAAVDQYDRRAISLQRPPRWCARAAGGS